MNDIAVAASDITTTIADRHVHPATVPLRFLKDAPRTLLGLPAIYAVMSDVGWPIVLRFAALLAAALLVGQYVAWRRFRYGVGEADIVIESGILNRTRRSIPFDRIQDIDIERGPLQRLFDLATIRIETGGAAKDEGLIDSITVAQADALRAAIRTAKSERALLSADFGTVAPTSADPRTIYAMALPRVLAAGVFNFSLLYLAGLAGLLQTFRGLLPFDIEDIGRWLGFARGERGEIDPRIVGAALLIAGGVGLALSVARTLASDYGFTLSAEGRRFRRTRGLFTRSEVVLSKARVQTALRRTGPVRRAAGFSALSFQTLGGVAGGGDRQDVAPLATNAEAALILAEQGRLLLPQRDLLELVSRRHLIRSASALLLPAVVAVMVAGVRYPPAWFGLASLPFLLVLAWLQRRAHRYALIGNMLYVESGVWRQSLWIVPVASTQTLTITQGPIQRLLGLSSLTIDTAGAPAMGGARIVDLRTDRARNLYEALSALRPGYSGRKSGTDR